MGVDNDDESGHEHLAHAGANICMLLKNTVHFGQKGAEDFTIHKDPERKE